MAAAAVRVAPNRDPEVARRLEEEAGWRRAPGDVERRFALDPDGHFVARDGAGEALGSASCVAYPDGALAWVGGMVVRAHARRRGVGRALLRACLAHAQARGARAVGLDATAEGMPLYAREGFVAVGRTPRWVRPPGAARPVLPDAPYAVQPVSLPELPEVAAYDAPRFGAQRARWLAALLAQWPDRAFLAYDRRGGALAGFAFGHGGGVGPLVADAPEAALRLLAACEAAGAPARAQLLGVNAGAERAFARAGWRAEGYACTRMARGPLPGQPASVYALASWAVG